VSAAADPRPALYWRTLFDSPLLLGSGAAIVLACIAVVAVAGAIRRAEVVRLATAEATARIAAEAAAAQFVGSDDSCGREQVSIGGVRVLLQDRGADCWITTEVGGEVHRFRCAQLGGAAPEPFAHPCSAADPSALRSTISTRPVQRAEPPRLDPAALERAARADRSNGFLRDDGVALLAWETGTERDDFVFDRQALCTGLDELGGLVVVPGNLWVEVGDRPLRLELGRDLVVAVLGNVYLGRSLQVDGPGRLVLVAAAAPGTTAFVDADANGRWSGADRLLGAEAFAGPFEGAGSVYLGLRRGQGPLRVDASLVVAGELHLGTAAKVAGPVVLAHGVTPTVASGARLEARGEWSFRVQRERVAGFATTGRPRPGLLQAHEPDAALRTEQGLYRPPLAR
jgi:hypothetical protein